MFSVQQFKIKLGEAADGYSDKQIEQIRDELYKFAEIAFDMWAKTKLKSAGRLKEKVV